MRIKNYVSSDWFLVILFFTGIALVGSEGAHLPWPHMAGSILIGLSSVNATTAIFRLKGSC
jgi:hypothetical protein